MKWIIFLVMFWGLLGCGANDGVSLKSLPSVTPPSSPAPVPANLSVTYDGNSSSGGIVPVDSTTYDENDTVTVLGNSGALVKTGMTFIGWNTAADGSGTSYAVNSTFAIVADTTLYAQWTLSSATYSVTYSGNTSTSGVAPVDENSPYQFGSTVTVLSNVGSLVKSGTNFVGWNTAADGSGASYATASTFSMPALNLTLYAHWKSGYLVIYDGNGASAGSVPSDSQSPYASGATVTVLGNTGRLVKDGYAFAGWNSNVGGTGTNYAAASTFVMPSSSRTLYAKWTLLPTYSITYNGNGSDGGTVPADSNTYWTGATVPVATNTGSLTKSGYTFAGWGIVTDGSQHTVGDSFYMPSANVTLNAQWIAAGSYRVSYNGNGHSGGAVPTDNNSPYVAGNAVTVLGNTGALTRGSDVFLGWNTSSNGTGTDYAAGSTFSASAHTVLYARWTPSYTVSFDANGGTGSMSAVSIASGTTANLPANTLTRASYVFAGWATSVSGPVIYNDKQGYTMGSSNKTLYAKWMAASSLKVSYNFNAQNAQDTSGNGQHGTVNNVTYVPDGDGNYAVRMNGTSSYVSVPLGMVMNSPQFTIMMRFKASPSQHGSLFGYQNAPVGDVGANQHVPMIVVRSDGRLRGELWKSTNAELEVISSNAVNDGKWHTVYFSSNGTTIKLFLDGVLLGQASSSVNHLTMNYNQIGVSRTFGRTLMPNVSTSANNWYYFNGLIDDFSLYNTAL